MVVVTRMATALAHVVGDNSDAHFRRRRCVSKTFLAHGTPGTVASAWRREALPGPWHRCSRLRRALDWSGSLGPLPRRRRRTRWALRLRSSADRHRWRRARHCTTNVKYFTLGLSQIQKFWRGLWHLWRRWRRGLRNRHLLGRGDIKWPLCGRRRPSSETRRFQNGSVILVIIN